MVFWPQEPPRGGGGRGPGRWDSAEDWTGQETGRSRARKPGLPPRERLGRGVRLRVRAAHCSTAWGPRLWGRPWPFLPAVWLQAAERQRHSLIPPWSSGAGAAVCGALGGQRRLRPGRCQGHRRRAWRPAPLATRPSRLRSSNAAQGCGSRLSGECGSPGLAGAGEG